MSEAEWHLFPQLPPPLGENGLWKILLHWPLSFFSPLRAANMGENAVGRNGSAKTQRRSGDCSSDLCVALPFGQRSRGTISWSSPVSPLLLALPSGSNLLSLHTKWWFFFTDLPSKYSSVSRLRPMTLTTLQTKAVFVLYLSGYTNNVSYSRFTRTLFLPPTNFPRNFCPMQQVYSNPPLQ